MIAEKAWYQELEVTIHTSVVTTSIQLTGMGTHYKIAKTTDSLPPAKVHLQKFPRPSENNHHPGDI